MLGEALQVAGDGVFDIGERCFSRGALADAAGEAGAVSDEDAVFVLFDQDSEFHRRSRGASNGSAVSVRGGGVWC